MSARPSRGLDRAAAVLEVEPGDAFSEQANFGDATAADLEALEMPPNASESNDLDATRVGVVEESDFIQNAPNSAGDFGAKTETWGALQDDSSEFEPTPLFHAEIVPSNDLDRSLPTGDGFGEKTESWSPLAPQFDEASDGTIEGVTLEPLPAVMSANIAKVAQRPDVAGAFPDEETPVHAPNPMRGPSKSAAAIRDSRLDSADRDAPRERSVSRVGGPGQSAASSDPKVRALRLPTKPAIDLVRSPQRAASEAAPALLDESTAASESNESLDAADRRRPLLVGVGLLLVAALFAAGLLLSRFFR